MSDEAQVPRGGRRRAEPQPAAASARTPLLAVAAVLLVTAALIGWAGNRDAVPPSASSGASEVPVDAATLTCRGIGEQDGRRSAVLSVVGEQAPTDSATDVSTSVLPSGDERPALAPPDVGELVSVALPAGSSGLRLDAGADTATALQAWTAASAERDLGAGLAVASCARPQPDGWFLGAGSTLDQGSTVLLSNHGSTSTVTDVTFLGADGELAPGRTQGIVLEPGAELELELAEVIAGAADVAVHVQTREGQVTAQVLDTWTDGQSPGGTEWIPPSTAPVTRALLPGLPTDAADQQVVVANPGDLGAVVSVQVVGPRATYVPEGLADLTVPARSTETVSLPAGLDGDVVSLVTESDRPVLTTVRSTTRGQRDDIAYTVAASAMSRPTAAPVALPSGIGRGHGRQLLALVATGPDAEVQVDALDASGAEVATLDVDVPRGATTVVDLSRRGDLDLSRREARQVTHVVLVPDGDVGAALLYRVAGLSVLPVEPVPSTVVAPHVFPRGVSPRR